MTSPKPPTALGLISSTVSHEGDRLFPVGSRSLLAGRLRGGRGGTAVNSGSCAGRFRAAGCARATNRSLPRDAARVPLSSKRAGRVAELEARRRRERNTDGRP